MMEAARLVLAVGLVLHSVDMRRFRSGTVVVTTPSAARHTVLPVSVDLGFRGSTTTSAAVFLTRGGRATDARAWAATCAEACGFGRTAVKRAGRGG